MDVTNCQFVGAAADRIIIALPRCEMTRTEALVHAAWLVVIAETSNDFPSILEAVKRQRW